MKNQVCQYCGSLFEQDETTCRSCGSKKKMIEEQSYEPAQMPQYQHQAQFVPDVRQKSKIIAGLLAIFLGSLGVHNYYLGYNKKASIQLLITVLSCGAGIFVTALWSLIEAILIFAGQINVDAKGIPLKS